MEFDHEILLPQFSLDSLTCSGIAAVSTSIIAKSKSYKDVTNINLRIEQNNEERCMEQWKTKVECRVREKSR
jgi:hypothetical protein